MVGRWEGMWGGVVVRKEEERKGGGPELWRPFGSERTVIFALAQAQSREERREGLAACSGTESVKKKSCVARRKSTRLVINRPKTDGEAGEKQV